VAHLKEEVDELEEVRLAAEVALEHFVDQHLFVPCEASVKPSPLARCGVSSLTSTMNASLIAIFCTSSFRYLAEQ
jgi:hypothetical protein